METSFTRLVGCRLPLQQAAMGGVAGPELAGAVGRAGALGMLCEFDLESPSDRIQRALTLADGGCVGMGFFGQFVRDDLESFEAASADLHVVEVFWSVPEPLLIARARRAGNALVAWQVGSVATAVAAEDAGCDFVVAQGVEAGGHVRGSTPRDELLDEVLGAVSIPVVIAGGIATPTDVAAMISAGAAAVRVGTAFVATHESDAHPSYVDALLAARSGDETVLTQRFSVGWPDAPHRVLRSAVTAAEALEEEVAAEAGPADARYSVPRFSAVPPSRHTRGHIEAMALYAGAGVGDVTSRYPAAELTAHLVSELE